MSEYTLNQLWATLGLLGLLGAAYKLQSATSQRRAVFWGVVLVLCAWGVVVRLS
jgi:hypothetical protein